MPVTSPPREAYAAATGPEDALLVDVRTRAEWTYVGVPVLEGAHHDVAFVEWSTFPDGQVNERLRRRGARRGARAGAPGLPAVPLRRALEGRRRRADRGRVSARRSTCSRASRARTTTTGHRTVAGWKVAGLPGVRAEHGPAGLAPADPRRSGWVGAQRFRRDRRGAVPDLRLRLRVGRAGRGGVQGRGRALHLQPLRQPHGDDLRGADAPARGRRGVLRHGIRDGGGVRRAGGAVRRGRPGGVVAGAVRVVLRHPRRDPAALGGRDGLRRRRRPRPVARGAVGAHDRGVLRDAEQPDAGARRHRGGLRAGARGRGQGRRRQRLRHAGVLAPARVRRRRRRLLGDQAHRRPGPGARRSGARHRASSSTGR